MVKEQTAFKAFSKMSQRSTCFADEAFFLVKSANYSSAKLLGFSDY
jgi:hypothetical protein